MNEELKISPKCTLELGMLNVHLKRNVPEELQPKKIKIQDGLTIEGKSK